MAEHTVSFPEISANPSRSIDGLAAKERAPSNENAEGRSDMSMMSSIDVLNATPIGSTNINVPDAQPAHSPGTSINTSAWDNAMEAFMRADAECKAFEPVLFQAFEEYEKQRPRVEDLKIDRIAFGGKEVEYIAHGMDLDKYWQDWVAGEGKWWWGDKIKERKKAELDQIRAYRKERKRVAMATGVDDASRKADELCEAATDAEDALITMPAPHWEALLWKQDRLFGDLDREEGNVPGWSNEYVKPFFDDIRRLARETKA